MKVTEEQIARDMMKSGLDEDFACCLAQLDTAVKEGKEERLNDVVSRITGRDPKRLEAYIQECVERGVWAKR